MLSSNQYRFPEWLSWLDSPFGAALIMGITFCGYELCDFIIGFFKNKIKNKFNFL